MITLEPEAAGRGRDLVVRAIEECEGIRMARALSPDSPSARVRRFYYAYLDDAVDLTHALKALAEIPGVESVSQPTQRRLTATNGE